MAHESRSLGNAKKTNREKNNSNEGSLNYSLPALILYSEYKRKDSRNETFSYPEIICVIIMHNKVILYE